MPYKALKPCVLYGKQYYIGDMLPPEAVLPGAEAGLIRRGYIASIPETRVETVEVEKPVAVEKIVEKEVPLPFTLVFGQGNGEPVTAQIREVELQTAADILRMNAEDAIKSIQEAGGPASLLIVEYLDMRKTVVSAAQKRRADLVPATEEGGS